MFGFINLFSLCHSIAGETGHYVNGVEGLKAASLPPEGFYYRTYFAHYGADRLMDTKGNDLNLDLDLDIWASVHRFIWITDKKFLGGTYGYDIIIPFLDINFNLGKANLHDHQRGIADIIIEPMVLSWHDGKWDFAAAYGYYLSNGKFDLTRPASPGKGFNSHMLTLGATRNFTSGWHASILARYEIHGGKENIDVTPGDEFHFEWGIGKKVNSRWNAGLAGYCQWQVSDDKGSAVTWDPSIHDRVFAMGPEISAFYPDRKMQFDIRHLWEFDARDRPEGQMTSMTLTFIF
jgi:hypothetical protein